MARFWSLNFPFLTASASTNGACIFELKRVCKLAGHTVPQSSDGLTYNSSGDQITKIGTGAGGISNGKSWLVLQDPVGHQWCLQNNVTATDGLRVKFSRAAGFTGGSPGSTRVPSATDEVVIFGSGTDAAPTTPAFFGGSVSNNHILQIMASSTAPYGWYMIGYAARSTPEGIMAFDPLLTGSYNVSDADPYTLFCEGLLAGTNVCNEVSLSGIAPDGTNNPAKAFFQGVLHNVGCSTYNVAPSTIIPDGLLTNPVNDKDGVRSILVSRTSITTPPGGYKGVSSLFRWADQPRKTASVYNVNGVAKAFARFDSLLAVWDGSSMPST